MIGVSGRSCGYVRRRGSLCFRRVKSLRVSSACASALSSDSPLAAPRSWSLPDGFVRPPKTLAGWPSDPCARRCTGSAAALPHDVLPPVGEVLERSDAAPPRRTLTRNSEAPLIEARDRRTPTTWIHIATARCRVVTRALASPIAGAASPILATVASACGRPADLPDAEALREHLMLIVAR